MVDCAHEKRTLKRVMVFGVFDGLHAGHRAFLEQARGLGDHLIVCVTPDRVTEELKGRRPRRSLEERLAEVKADPRVDAAVPGDEVLRTWGVLDRCRPDVIALGYDQSALREELLARFAGDPSPPDIVVLEPYQPERYHSSLLRG